MEESVKNPKAEKAKAPAKASKAASPKRASAKAVSRKNGAPAEPVLLSRRSPSYEEVAELAHKYWAEGGYRDGHHEDDWYRAERDLRSKAS